MEPTANSVRSKNLLFLALAFFFLSISLEAQTDFEYYNIALVKFNIGDYKGAESDLTKAIDINPENSSAYVLRGAVKHNLENFQSAMEDFTKAIEIDSRQTGSRKLTIYDQKGNIVESSLPVKADPNMAVPYYNRGLSRHELEDYMGAIEDYNMAIEINPEMESAYHNRGYARFMSGDINGACLDWQKAFELGYAEASVLIKEHCSDNLHENH